MSDLETKIDAVLGKFESDLHDVANVLQPLLNRPDTDVTRTNDLQAAVPYTLSAYALSSLLFAYFRSEGKDTNLVMPELARVKKLMDKLGKLSSKQGTPEESTNDEDEVNGESKEGSSKTKSSGKHIRFDSKTGSKVKSSKRKLPSKKSSSSKKTKTTP